MPARRWSRALPLAALAVYLPTAAPFAVGPLTECGHCVTTYLQLLPVVPGIVSLALMSSRGDAASIAIAGACTLLLLAGCVAAARRLPPRDLAAVFAVLMPLIGLESYTFALLLRA